LTVGTQVSENIRDTVLDDDHEAFMRDAQTYETLLGVEPNSLELQIRQEAATSFIMCVRNIIA